MCHRKFGAIFSLCTFGLFSIFPKPTLWAHPAIPMLTFHGCRDFKGNQVDTTLLWRIGRESSRGFKVCQLGGLLGIGAHDLKGHQYFSGLVGVHLRFPLFDCTTHYQPLIAKDEFNLDQIKPCLVKGFSKAELKVKFRPLCLVPVVSLLPFSLFNDQTYWFGLGWERNFLRYFNFNFGVRFPMSGFFGFSIKGNKALPGLCSVQNLSSRIREVAVSAVTLPGVSPPPATPALNSTSATTPVSTPPTGNPSGIPSFPSPPTPSPSVVPTSAISAGSKKKTGHSPASSSFPSTPTLSPSVVPTSAISAGSKKKTGHSPASSSFPSTPTLSPSVVPTSAISAGSKQKTGHSPANSSLPSTPTLSPSVVPTSAISAGSNSPVSPPIAGLSSSPSFPWTPSLSQPNSPRPESLRIAPTPVATPSTSASEGETELADLTELTLPNTISYTKKIGTEDLSSIKEAFAEFVTTKQFVLHEEKGTFKPSLLKHLGGRSDKGKPAGGEKTTFETLVENPELVFSEEKEEWRGVKDMADMLDTTHLDAEAILASLWASQKIEGNYLLDLMGPVAVPSKIEGSINPTLGELIQSFKETLRQSPDSLPLRLIPLLIKQHFLLVVLHALPGPEPQVYGMLFNSMTNPDQTKKQYDQYFLKGSVTLLPAVGDYLQRHASRSCGAFVSDARFCILHHLVEKYLSNNKTIPNIKREDFLKTLVTPCLEEYVTAFKAVDTSAEQVQAWVVPTRQRLHNSVKVLRDTLK